MTAAASPPDPAASGTRVTPDPAASLSPAPPDPAAAASDGRLRPPGPGAPVSMEKIRTDPLGFLEEMAGRYGPISYHRTGVDDVYMVNEPELVGQVLMAGEDSFTKEGTPDDLMLTPLLGEGLLTSHGEEWKRQRDLTQPMFHRRRVEVFAPMMVEEARRLATRWTEAAGAGTPVRADHDLTGLTLTIVARAVVGGDLSGIGRGFGRAVDAVNAFLSHGDPRDTPDTAEVRADAAAYPKAVATLDGIVRLLVEGRRVAGGPDGEDLLAALLSGPGAAVGAAPLSDDARGPDPGCPARAHAGGPEGSLSSREVRDQVMTMIMAGHETTAKALTWALYLLDRHPGVRDALRSEVDSVLGGRDPGPGDLVDLAWCRAIVHETLRLFPPIWVISRRATRDETVAGYRVPKGSLVCVSPWVIHRHPGAWPRPTEFDPRRFLEGTPPASSHTFLPFGAGPRLCIGRGFAVMEAVLVLAALAQQVEMTLVPGHPIDVQALVTLRPRDGLVMSARPL